MSTTDTPVDDRDIFITRSFDAPRELVWRFWTEPDRLASWFGPDGFTVPTESVSITLVEGGEWNLTMVEDATGITSPLHTRFVTVREPEYLEMVIDGGDSNGFGELAELHLRVQFHDHGEKTRVTLHQGPFTEEQKTATATGWEMSFVTLDAILAGGLQ